MTEPRRDRSICSAASTSRAVSRRRPANLPLGACARCMICGDHVEEAGISAHSWAHLCHARPISRRRRCDSARHSGCRRIGHRPAVAACLFNLGGVQGWCGERDDALLCFERALAISTELGDLFRVYVIHGFRGQAHLLARRFPIGGGRSAAVPRSWPAGSVRTFSWAASGHTWPRLACTPVRSPRPQSCAGRPFRSPPKPTSPGAWASPGAPSPSVCLPPTRQTCRAPKRPSRKRSAIQETVWDANRTGLVSARPRPGSEHDGRWGGGQEDVGARGRDVRSHGHREGSGKGARDPRRA